MRALYDRRAEMRDGVTLSADVYLPDEPAPQPAVVVRTPYLKTDERVARDAEAFTARGYAYVCVDVRGRGDSDGSFDPYRGEDVDGYDTIEWAARQDWCDGRVATRGGSYLGRIQWFAALTHPPSLEAMIVAVAPSDPFVEFPTGIHTPMELCWLRLVHGRVPQNIEAVDWERVYRHLPLESMDEAAGFVSDAWRRDLGHGPGDDDYWGPLRYQDRFDEIDLPVLHISGWYDDEQVGTPLNFAGMSAHAATPEARRSQRLLMGPWGHRINTTRKLGEVDFGPDAVIDLFAYEIAFLDHHLKGGADRTPPVRLFVMGAGEWRDYGSWPPPEATAREFFLHGHGAANSRFGDGSLSLERPGDEPSDRFTYDPARPVPFITDQTSSQIGGPDDYSAIEQRADVLCYSTEKLTRPVEAIGPVRAILFVGADVVDTDVTAKLVDVHPDGFCQRICDGIVRMRFREGFDEERFLEPGAIYEVEVDLWNTALRFEVGHRIRMEISSSAFPKYDRNLNTGKDMASGTEMRAAVVELHHDDGHPSRLILLVT